MTKIQAIREASASVHLWKSGSTSYVVCGPYDLADLRGPSTEVTYPTRSQAVLCRAAWAARLALTMMDVDGDIGEAVDYVEYDVWADHSVRGIVDAAMARLAKAVA